MKTSQLLLSLSLLSTPAFAAPEPPARTDGAVLRLNSVGFLPSASKLATTTARCDKFSIVNLDTNKVVAELPAGAVVRTKPSDTDEEVQVLDFSGLTQPGRYAVQLPDGRQSAPFQVGEKVWNDAFRTVTRGLYLWRCGTALDFKSDTHHYHQDACHLHDGYLDFVGGPKGERRPSTGGWHDAGDYNKYIVNAGFTVGMLWKAWEQAKPALSQVQLDIPESGNAVPDFLDELRWEYDWLFTMQREDGLVYHKLSAQTFAFWGLPHLDKDPRFFAPWSTSATAHFAAMMALGARHFRDYDAAYADRCLAAARLSWKALLAHPQDVPSNMKDFKTGEYQALDPHPRLWAAVELWETTGESEFLAFFETHVQGKAFSRRGPGWGDPLDIALATYVTSPRSSAHNATLVKHLTSDVLAAAEAISAEAVRNPHGRPYGDAPETFFWGCFGDVAGQTLLLNTAYRLQPNAAYRDAVHASLSHLFGRNFHGRSYVTGLGFNPPVNAHDRRGTPTLPGYLVGGGHPTARDWHDVLADYSRNEIALNWNGTLIYALSTFVNP